MFSTYRRGSSAILLCTWFTIMNTWDFTNCLYYELETITIQHDGLGTIVNVLVDEEQGLISRTFQAGYQTVSGKKHDFTEEQVNEF